MRIIFSQKKFFAAVLALAVLAALLYPGSCPAAWSTWTQWNTNGFGDSQNHEVRALTVFNDDLYPGTYNKPGRGTGLAL